MLERVDSISLTSLTLEPWLMDEDQLSLVPWKTLRAAMHSNLSQLARLVVQVIWEDVDKFQYARGDAEKSRRVQDRVGIERKIREGLGIGDRRSLVVEFGEAAS